MPLMPSGQRAAGDFRSGAGQLGRKLLGEWESFVPRDELGQPMQHAGPFAPLMGFLGGGGFSAVDETGTIEAGPGGIRLSRTGEDGRPAWSAAINPAVQGVEFQKGDVGASLNWNDGQPSGRLKLGNVVFSGGTGIAPGGSGQALAPGAPQERYGTGFLEDGISDRRQSGAMPPPPGQPGAWGRIDVSFGGKRGMGPPSLLPMRAGSAVARAVSPFEQAVVEQSQPTAREELELQIDQYRRANPYWYRP